MNKILEIIGAVLFGFGIGAGIVLHYTNIGIICFIASGVLWLISTIIKKETRENK